MYANTNVTRSGPVVWAHRLKRVSVKKNNSTDIGKTNIPTDKTKPYKKRDVTVREMKIISVYTVIL